MAQRTFKYRIYPTKHQQTLFEQTLEECRWCYNETLAYRKNSWESEQKSVSLYDTNAFLKNWKSGKESLKSVHSQVLYNVQVRVDLAFKAFFRRVKAGEKPGYPRFKGFGRYDSFTYPQSGWKFTEGKLRLSKIGFVKIKLHRPIEGQIKTCTIRRSNGKWFVCFSCIDVPSHPLKPSNKIKNNPLIHLS